MNKEVLIDVGSQLAHLRMYPLFDTCHYLLTALQVRDDIQQYQTGNTIYRNSIDINMRRQIYLSVKYLLHRGAAFFVLSIVCLATQNNFTRRHPLSCWLSTMLLCFSGTILSNFLLGESPIKDFLHHQHLLLATVCWYAVFYSPIDLIARLIRFLPVRLILGVAKEIQRTKKIYHGVHSTLALYPDGYIIVVLIGAIKGKRTM